MKKLEIRNSTAEFLNFQIEGKEDGMQVGFIKRIVSDKKSKWQILK